MKDSQARLQALQIQQSFIIQAPAGSGKTELLIQRLLVLLAKAQNPEDILAITFTKKAAGEMRERLLYALEFAQSHPCPDTPHQALTWQLAQAVLLQDAKQKWNLLEAPQQLRIQTIDAFCVYLREQFPLQSDWGQGFQLLLQADFLYEKSVDLLFSFGEKSPCHHELFILLKALDNDFEKCKSWLVALLRCRDQWLSFLSLNDSDEKNKDILENFLKTLVEYTLEEAAALFPESLKSEWISLARLFASTINSESKAPILSCHDILHFPNSTNKELPAWRGLCDMLLTKAGELRKKVANEWKLQAHLDAKEILSIKNRFKICLAEFEKHPSWQSILVDISKLPNPHYGEDEWQLLSAILHILKTLLAILLLQFKEKKQLDTIENTQAAMRILGEEDAPSDFMLLLDYKIQHILIDEFQDTSPTQWNLFKKLLSGWQEGDGRSLFLVGDPMQSIYRFRDADVSLFLNIQEKGLTNIVIKPLYLSSNFRSCANLVEWTKNHFQWIFPKKNNLLKGEVCFIESEAIKSSEYPDLNATFHAHPSHLQASHLQDLIENILILRSRFPKHSIAILIRARAHATPLLQALQKNGIPFLAQDIEYLSDRSYIRDLCALTLALHDLADRTHWLAILRAPWCGMSLADIEIISGSHPKKTIWECLQLQEIKQQLSPLGQTQLERIFPALKHYINERERLPLEIAIKQCWLYLGGAATLTQESALTDVDDFFVFLKHLSKEHLQATYLEKKIRTLFARPQNHPDQNPIQIMTIHNAKGLEFDHVFLFGLEKSTAINEKPLLTWIDQFALHPSHLKESTSGLLLACRGKYQHISLLYEFIHDLKEDKIRAEIKRLLYVAVTRAKHSLHLFFQSDVDAKGQIKNPASHSLLNLFYKQLPSALLDSLATENAQNPEINNKDTSDSYEPRLLHRIASNWEHPLPFSKQSTIELHSGKSGIRFDVDKQAYLGTLVHNLLQKITQLSLKTFDSYSDTLKKLWVTRQAKHLIFPQSELNILIQDALHLIENMLHDETGRLILSHEGESEKPISIDLDGKIRHLTVDRTFVDKNNIRWIIDYKTGRPSPHQNQKHFLEEEKKHHQPQLNFYSKALRELDQRKQIVGLYFLSLGKFATFDESELLD